MAEPARQPDDTSLLLRAIALLKMLSDEEAEEEERMRASLELSNLEKSNSGVTERAQQSMRSETATTTSGDADGTSDASNVDEAEGQTETEETSDDDAKPDEINDGAPAGEGENAVPEDATPDSSKEEESKDDSKPPESAKPEGGANTDSENEPKEDAPPDEDAEPEGGEAPDSENETSEGAPASEGQEEGAPNEASPPSGEPSPADAVSDAGASSDSNDSTPAPTPSEGAPAANDSQPAKTDAAEAAPAQASEQKSREGGVEAPASKKDAAQEKQQEPEGSGVAPVPQGKEGLIAKTEQTADKAAEKTEDPLMKILDKENVDRLADAVDATAAERKAVDDARKVAQGALAVGEGLSGDVTPATVVKTIQGAKAAKEFLQKGEKEQLASFGGKLQGALGDLPKLAFDAAKKLIVDAAKLAVKGVVVGVILPILLGFLIFVIFIAIIVQVLGLAKGADNTQLDPQGGEKTAQVGSPGPVRDGGLGAVATRGFLQSEPSLLLGLSTEMMLALNACGDVAPIVVTFGVGGPPGTARYEGRAVGLSTQSVERDTVAALEACLAAQGGLCVEELLGPDPDHCVTTGPNAACEEQRRAHILRSNSEISFALKRGCVTSASAALAESSPAP